MSPKKRGGKGACCSLQEAGDDRLGALPDDVLHHVLSFLPAHDAVRTCVLARHWRHLWKSATSLRIVRRDLVGPEAVKEAREFVDHLLLLRGGSPLDTCDLSLADFLFDENDTKCLNQWIRHILMCKVQVLSLDILRHSRWVVLDGLTLISDHLKRLQLSNIEWDDKLDFSCCPALEVLEIAECNLSCAKKISSQSLKCLSISSDCCLSNCFRTRIYVPNLQSLWLEVGYERTPKLDRMPYLVDAFVKLSDCYLDCCLNSTVSGDCKDAKCYPCYGIDGDTKNYVLLQGLIEARNLALVSDVEAFIFIRDLKFCPVFANLKTLFLNEYWCVPSDFSALTYMLEHSPVLVKLTLQLFCEGPKSKVEMKGIPDPTERSAAVSEHLKIVLDVLKFLSKLGIYGN